MLLGVAGEGPTVAQTIVEKPRLEEINVVSIRGMMQPIMGPTRQPSWTGMGFRRRKASGSVPRRLPAAAVTDCHMFFFVFFWGGRGGLPALPFPMASS